MYTHADWVAEHCIGGEDMVALQVEVRKTELWDECANRHRFFALEEFISNESTKTSSIALACTQCGSLVVHRVQAE
jgi:hypothetical protein